MKYLSHIFFYVLVAAILFSCKPKMDVSPAVAIADSLRQEYAPDDRTTDFHIHFEQRGADQLLVEGETSSDSLGSALMSRLKREFPNIIDSFTILPSKEFADHNIGLVRIGVSPVREEPSFSSQQVTQALMGMPVRLLKKKDHWIRVQLPDRYLGWIEENSIVRLDEQQHRDWMKRDRALVTRLHVPVLEAPKTKAACIAQLSAGALLKVRNSSADWTKVSLPDQRRGWIENKHIIGTDRWRQLAESSSSIDWVNTAMNFKGLSYLWGGTSGYGVDCSGFTKMALYLNGLIIPRDASQQVEAGIALDLEPDSNIDWKQYRIGDLFFFGTVREDGSHRITHVAFHTGEGDVLHSTTWVREESLNVQDSLFNDYRRNTLLEARRFDTEGKHSGSIVPIGDHPWYFPKDKHSMD